MTQILNKYYIRRRDAEKLQYGGAQEVQLFTRRDWDVERDERHYVGDGEDDPVLYMPERNPDSLVPIDFDVADYI